MRRRPDRVLASEKKHPNSFTIWAPAGASIAMFVLVYVLFLEDERGDAGVLLTVFTVLTTAFSLSGGALLALRRRVEDLERRLDAADSAPKEERRSVNLGEAS